MSPKHEYGVRWVSTGRCWPPTHWLPTKEDAKRERKRLVKKLEPATENPFSFEIVRRKKPKIEVVDD